MKIHTDEDDEFKDERVLEAVDTKNKFQKRGKKTRVSKHLQAMQTHMKYPSEIMNMNEGGRERKFHRMDFKTDKAIRLQKVT